MKFISLFFATVLSLSLSTAYATADDIENKPLAEIQQLANEGNADAQLELADRYYEGNGVEENDEQAKIWYMKAAEQGNADAQYELGAMYFNEQESAKAIPWFKKAAAQGNADAQFQLGIMYINGFGTASNYKTAFEYIKDAAENNLPMAQFVLSGLYIDGIGVKKSDSQAYFWFSIFKRGEKDLEFTEIPEIKKSLQNIEKKTQQTEKSMSQSELQESKRLQDDFISKHNHSIQ
ncbi:tetratricopeptide repeat protein [Pectobacterium polaris]|uniref:tetratricopeptide repeat protein n=1 Tax=Pectobacterium polaris TaxID=2042057 RepID=UPI001F307425|nr:tetratricopeptide repeat protein [Pectobacterium polaris]